MVVVGGLKEEEGRRESVRERERKTETSLNVNVSLFLQSHPVCVSRLVPQSSTRRYKGLREERQNTHIVSGPHGCISWELATEQILMGYGPP